MEMISLFKIKINSIFYTINRKLLTILPKLMINQFLKKYIHKILYIFFF